MNTHFRSIGLLLVLFTLLALAGCSQPAVQAAESRFAYVANAADGTVSAIDLERDQVAWTLPIGERAAHGIAASPDGRIVYAGDAAAREVVVIDARRQAVVKRIPLSTAVHGIDIAPDGRTLWVGGSRDDDPILGTLTVINTASNTVEDVISPGLGSASHFAFTPDSQQVWIASTSTNLVWIVDAASRQAVAAVPLTVPATAQRPAPGDDWDAYLAERRIIGLNEVAISPDGRRAYAVGPTASQLYAIDVKERRVLQSVPAGQRAHGVSVSPDGKEVWIADWTGVLTVFDAQSLEQIATIPMAETAGELERGANHVAFSRDGRRVYVTGANDVAILDARERRVLEYITVGQEPHELSLEDWVAPDARINTEAILDALQNDLSAGMDGVPPEPSQMEVRGLVRTSDGGGVVVEVDPVSLEGDGPTLDFQVTLDTHSVELNYDLAGLAVLRDDQGNEYRPVSWDAPQGGHHVAGILTFEGRSQILRPDLQSLELELTDIAKVPSRTFRWEFVQ